jgi:membrane-bound serine protease (ClpP class)
MRTIVKAVLASEVPVVVYIAPTGARAASAGVFITLAAHRAAMAPGTNIGAAHPVALGGGSMDEEMKRKVENDAAAYIKSLAERRGRNAQWAEDAVRKSVSVTEREALGLRLIDAVAPDLPSLLDQLHGLEVVTAAGTRRLATKGAEVAEYPMGLRLRALSVLSDPNVAYILMLIGIYGLIFELSNPGAIFPGVVADRIDPAFYAFQTLPINYAACC